MKSIAGEIFTVVNHEGRYLNFRGLYTKSKKFYIRYECEYIEVKEIGKDALGFSIYTPVIKLHMKAKNY